MIIWKYQLALVQTQAVEIPVGAKLLHIAQQGGLPTMWFEVDPHAERERRFFAVIGTGHLVPKPSDYVGTVTPGGLVWHIYEVT